MSEFTEVHYLKAETSEAGRSLLRQIGRQGYVFEPNNGWVAIIPVGGMGWLNDSVVAATGSTAPLLWFMHAADFGWGFCIAKDAKVVFQYSYSSDEGRVMEVLGWEDLDKHLASFGARLDDDQKKEIFGEKESAEDCSECASRFASCLWLPHSSFVSEYHFGGDVEHPNCGADEMVGMSVVR